MFLLLQSLLLSFSLFAADPAWVTSWSTSVHAVHAPLNLNNQSLKQTVRVSAGGNIWRVRLSNLFSDSAVSVGAAQLGLKQGQNRRLTVGGRSRFTIPARGELFSDPVTLAVSAASDLVISLYFPGPTTLRSYHRMSLQTNSIVAGDFSRFTILAPATTNIGSWYLLAGVDVVAADTKAIVVLGDSITDGAGSKSDANHRWPDYLAARLRAARKPFAVANQGISGNQVLKDQPGGHVPSLAAMNRFSQDVLKQPGAAYVILLAGINDIGQAPASTDPEELAERLIAGYRKMITEARVRGLKIYGATLTPVGESVYGAEPRLQMRRLVNEWIRNSGAFDAVIDFDQALRDPANPEKMRAAYDCGDKLHPNDAGYQAMAAAIDLNLFR